MKRNALIILSIVIVFSVLLCGCKPRILSESEIIASLPTDLKTVDINGSSTPLDVEQFELLLRKTTDDIDEIHCELVLSDGTYVNTVDCVLTYTYYDTGGWVLDFWDVTSAELTSIVGVSQIEADHELGLYYFDTFEFQSQSFDTQDQISYSSYNVSYTGTTYSYNGSVTLESIFVTDWFSGYWVHELQYDNAFEWDLAGTWAAGRDDIHDSTWYDLSDAFALYIDMDSISPYNEITFSATAYESISSIFTTQNWKSRDINNYYTEIYMLPSESEYDSYKEPTWRMDFYIEHSDFSIEITPDSLLLLEHDCHLGTLYRGYIIAVSTSSYGYAIFERIPA